ncbi:MAG: hypothetical protein GDA49_14210, partial [Rhodospirillales bacterium]|nr:hypothetical protein [Rhodospirillales bacterium]
MNRLLNLAAGMALIAAASALSSSGSASDANDGVPSASDGVASDRGASASAVVTLDGAGAPVSSFTLRSRLYRNAFAVGNDKVISERGFRRLNRDLSSIDAAVAADSLEAPDALPDAKGVLQGYYRMGSPAYEDHHDRDRDIVGNLRVYADFGAGRVTTAVNGFRQFIVSNPNRPVGGLPMKGALSGRGMIDKTTISSTLDGMIYVPYVDDHDGDHALYEVVIDADMAGKVYDHHGRLLVRGGVTGTHDAGWYLPGSIEDGEFFAIQTGNGKPVQVIKFG